MIDISEISLPKFFIDKMKQLELKPTGSEKRFFLAYNRICSPLLLDKVV